MLETNEMWIVQQVLSQLAETALWSSTSGMWQVFLSRGEWGEEQTWLITLKEVLKGKERKESLATVLFKPFWLIDNWESLTALYIHWSLTWSYLLEIIDRWKERVRIFCISLIVEKERTVSLKRIHEARQFCIYLYHDHLYLLQITDH